MMESDPPPSYNSVVEDQLRRRIRGGGEIQKSECDDGRPGADKRIGHSSGPTDVSSCIVDPQRSKEQVASPVSSTTMSAQQDGGQKSQVQCTSLWERFKKGLEDLALFVIQILD